MTTFGISMVKNEEDIIFTTINHMIYHVDHIIVADNLSTDSTRDILKSFSSDMVTVVDDNEVGYYQSQKMTSLAHKAMNLGADWVVPFDADEIWFSKHYDTIADHLDEVPDKFACVIADWFHHGVTKFDDDNVENPFFRMRYRLKEKATMKKIAARCSPKLIIEQGNHYMQYGGPFNTYNINLECRHFPYRSVNQFVSKVTNGANAYKIAQDLPAHMGSHWREYAAEIEEHGYEKAVAIFNSLKEESIDNFVEDPAPVKI